MMPAGVLHRAEAAPQGAVRLQPVTVQLLGEQRLTEPDRLGFAGLVEAGGAPRLLAGFDDEGRMAGLVLIGVPPPQAVRVGLEEEGARREGPRRAEPHEASGPPNDARVEGV